PPSKLAPYESPKTPPVNPEIVVSAKICQSSARGSRLNGYNSAGGLWLRFATVPITDLTNNTPHEMSTKTIGYLAE
ncbi:hypothetical protein, partial [Paracoccus saliphilus]|uniref:hypothetical protein n=1 Tax=Paracoccus saliphilus TaxID=405559 RepID=UPI0026574032